MSLGHGASIVRDGLVLHLDAANPKSYPGSGTSWFDLSSNANNGTLVNGVGYSADNKGAMVFDGVNDSSYFPNEIGILDNNPWTISIWANVSTSEIGAGRKGWLIWKGPSNQAANQLISMGVTSNSIEIANWSNDTVFSNALVNFGNWAMYSCTFDGTTIKVYVDSIQLGSKTTTLSIIAGGWYLASRTSVTDFLNYSVSVFHLYNRALTEQEIKQNFEATRGRYGI
jgi:hypothetical protein